MELGGGASAGLEAVIRQALSKKIARRFPSVDEFWRAFNANWVTDLPSVDSRHAPHAISKTRRRLIAASLVAALGAGGLALRFSTMPSARVDRLKPDAGSLVEASSPLAAPVTNATSPTVVPVRTSVGQSAPDAGGTDAIAPTKRPRPRTKQKTPKLFETL